MLKSRLLSETSNMKNKKYRHTQAQKKHTNNTHKKENRYWSILSVRQTSSLHVHSYYVTGPVMKTKTYYFSQLFHSKQRLRLSVKKCRKKKSSYFSHLIVKTVNNKKSSVNRNQTNQLGQCVHICIYFSFMVAILTLNI